MSVLATLAETLSSAGNVVDQIGIIVPKIISTAAVLAALIPKQAGWFGRVQDYVNLAAFNFGHAANKT